MVCIKFPILVYFYLFWSFVSRWWDFNEGRWRACYCCTTTTIVFDAIFLYLLQQLSLLGHFWVQLQKHKLACINVLCLPTSVTRCQSKKQPNFLKKLLKKYQFNIKSAIFTIAQNVARYLGFCCKKLCSKELSKIAQSGHTVAYLDITFR